MRILVLAPQPFFAERGTPIAVRSLVEELNEMGHEVDLLTYHEGEDVDLGGIRHVRAAGAPGLQDIPPGFSLKKVACDISFFLRASGLVWRGDYDLVHAVEESAFMGLLFKTVGNVPFVYDMDSSLPEQLTSQFGGLPSPVSGALERAERRAIRSSLAVLTVCERLEDRAVDAAGSSGKVGRVEDYSLLGEVRDDVEDLHETIGSPGPIVLYVGNLQPYQGVDLLVEAFPHALREVPEVQLVVIGGSPENVEAYRERAVDVGISDRSHFLGPRPVENLAGYLHQATVLASPRTSGTNTPMKIYSYLDSGVPIVATRLETHTQVLNDDISVLAPPEAEPYGRALGGLLADPERRKRISERARIVADEEYSREAFGRKVRSFYRRVEELAPTGT